MHRRVGSALAVFLVAALSTAAPAVAQEQAPLPTAPPPGGERIVNGSSGIYVPWQVAIVSRPNPAVLPTGLPIQPFCGGTLRDATHVVTAAHCLPDHPGDDPIEIAVVTGFRNRQNPNVDGTALVTSVTAITTHPSYRSSVGGFDVAVLTLGASIPTVAGFVEPIDEVTAANFGGYVGVSSLISGWGTTSSGGSQPDELQYAVVQVYADGACGNYGAGFKPATMLCAGEDSGGPNAVIDSCQGDSGGPLIGWAGDIAPTNGGYDIDEFTRLIGVVSWGNGCADAAFPGVYTRLTEPSTNALAVAPTPTPRVQRLADPVLSGTASSLSCSAAQWGNSPTSITRSWLRVTQEGNPAQITAVEEIAGQTGSTYAPDPNVDGGKYIACEERATNAGGSLTQVSDLLGPIPPPAPPPNPTPTTTPTTPVTPSTPSTPATPTVPDPDGDGVTTADRCPKLGRGTFDLDSDGCPGPFKELKVSFAVDKDRTGKRLFALRLSGIPRGARVTVRCSSCSGARRSISVKAPVTRTRLTKALRRLRGVTLSRRTFTITATAPGYVGKVGTLRFTARRSLRISARCLQPGSSTPRRTCDTTPGLPGGTVEI